MFLGLNLGLFGARETRPPDIWIALRPCRTAPYSQTSLTSLLGQLYPLNEFIVISKEHFLLNVTKSPRHNETFLIPLKLFVTEILFYYFECTLNSVFLNNFLWILFLDPERVVMAIKLIFWTTEHWFSLNSVFMTSFRHVTQVNYWSTVNSA